MDTDARKLLTDALVAWHDTGLSNVDPMLDLLRAVFLRGLNSMLDSVPGPSEVCDDFDFRINFLFDSITALEKEVAALKATITAMTTIRVEPPVGPVSVMTPFFTQGFDSGALMSNEPTDAPEPPGKTAEKSTGLEPRKPRVGDLVRPKPGCMYYGKDDWPARIVWADDFKIIFDKLTPTWHLQSGKAIDEFSKYWEWLDEPTVHISGLAADASPETLEALGCVINAAIEHFDALKHANAPAEATKYNVGDVFRYRGDPGYGAETVEAPIEGFSKDGSLLWFRYVENTTCTGTQFLWPVPILDRSWEFVRYAESPVEAPESVPERVDGELPTEAPQTGTDGAVDGQNREIKAKRRRGLKVSRR